MPRPEPATAQLDRLDMEATRVGSVFVSNYPPYSFWSADQLARVDEVLDAPPRPGATMGLYVHIPFCRRRCKFCYFRVFTDKDSSQIERYIDAVCREARLYEDRRAIADRSLRFIYFGGGTPSYISVKHLRRLVESLKEAFDWEGCEEFAFECEPGTLTRSKLEAIRDVGVTRLSLGIENFNDEILRENGRAHLSEEIYRVKPWIEELEFDQLNIDLIAGMVGETWETWRDTVKRTIEYDPDSVTIYQMELPFNTIYSKGVLEGESGERFADWSTKREWHAYAFEELAKAGYELSSAYTMVKKGRPCRFVYRDAVWEGSDMVGVGVSSFSHMSGVHFQNVDRWEEYLELVESGKLPLNRSFDTSEEERLTRELILQLKRGFLDTEYFRRKFSSDIDRTFGETFDRLKARGLLTMEGSDIRLSEDALLRVDQLLPHFYDDKYRDARYT